MISFFNKLGNSWIAKGIFFLLGLSMMAFWGLGGISNTSNSDGTAIKVGSNKVSMQDLSRAFDTERNKMAKILGRYMTPKRAIQAGLLDQVVQQLALRELNAQIQDEVGLIASDEAVRRYIEQNPVFKDSLGKFDANLFYGYLTGMNMTQAEFAHQMRMELANQHLARSVMVATPRNKDLMEKVALAKKEKREIVSVLLTPDDMSVTTPTEEELKDYYEAYQEEFGIPEYRQVRVVSFNAADFSNDYDKMVEVSHQLEDLLGAGQTLAEAAVALKLNVAQSLTIDATGKDKSGKEISEKIKPLLPEVFALSEGEATSLMEIENGFMVAGLEKVIPAGYKKFAEVKNDVAALWRQENQKEKLNQVAEEILTSVQQGRGWKNHTPATQIISRSDVGNFPKTIAAILLTQKVGAENVQKFSTDQGIVLAYTKRIIPSREIPTEAELQEAVKDWSMDLMGAVQQSYAKKYPIDIRTSAIQKAFSIYENQDE